MSDLATTSEPTLSPEEAQRVDCVCDRFENAWKSGQRPELKSFLENLDTPIGKVMLRELLEVEFAYRVRGGEQPTLEEYQANFPDHANLIEAVFAKAMNIGRYQVLRRLGGGTYGDVYLAYDTEMHRQVAIKVPSARLLATDRARAEFLLEARSVARLQYEGIVRAHDLGEADGRCYIVYEFVDGESLAERIKPERIAADPLPPHEAARIIAQVAEALHYAHLQGIFHRDVKPANILLHRQGTPKVTDFGAAVREEDLAGQRGILAGTLRYMSPEQVRREGHHIDGRTDIYSLGVVLYELLCGRRPFEAKTKDELEDQILYREARPFRQIKDSIPAELERICLKALSKRIRDRYTTAKDMAAELGNLARQAHHPRRFESPEPVQELGKGPKNLLHLIWDFLDYNLQDAFSLAYNKKRREGSNRISTRDFFQALLRISDDALRTMVESLPKGALPDPVGADIGVDRHLLNANPLLSDCVEDSLSHFIKLAPFPRKLSPIDIFVDIGQHGHGPSVARLRNHGVTPEELEKRIKKHGLSVVRRQTDEETGQKPVVTPVPTAFPSASPAEGSTRVPRLLEIHQKGKTAIVQVLCGELSDEQASVRFRAEFRALLDNSDVEEIVLDIPNVTYVSSSVFAVLFALCRQLRERGGKLKLCRLSGSVTDYLTFLGLGPYFEILQQAPNYESGTPSPILHGMCGPYVVERMISSGGRHTVVAAHREASNVQVAVTLRPMLSGDEEEQCLKQMREFAKLRHPGIVKVHDFGLADGYFYVATDLLSRPSLATWLAGPVQPGRRLRRSLLGHLKL
jgi:anti-anti-sigma factor